MALQKYRADESQERFANGGILWVANWNGGPSPAKIENCKIDGFPHIRRTVYITGEADTYFSIPAACKVSGRTVRGYVTGTESGLEFRVMNSSRSILESAKVKLIRETEAAPDSWASALINGDESGLRDYDPDPDDIAAYESFRAYLVDNAMDVVGCGESYFSNQASIHWSAYSGGNLCDYEILRRKA